MTANSGQPSPWQLMIQRSFLSLYLLPQSKMTTDEWFRGYDYVFEFAHATLYLLIDANQLKTNNPQVSNSHIAELRKKTLNQQIKRHSQLHRKNLKANPKLSAESDSSSTKPTYFVGLTSLTIEQKNKSYIITHQYGSQFFAEECVLDLDDENCALQIFSLQSFADIINRLQTPSDLQVFLQFHRSRLVEQQPFADEATLLEQFLTSPEFYQHAIAVQSQLVDIGLLDEVEPRLLNATAPGKSAQTKALSEKLQTHTKMWYKLINGLIKRLHKADSPLDVDLVKMLISESMYTRNCIMEEVMAYPESRPESRRQGYVRHQHSYNAFGRHYMMVFYAQDKSSALSAESVRANHHDMLFEVNAQLQKPVMDDLFLLGIGFSRHEASGNTEVLLDVYHQAGSVMNAGVQRLYEQLVALKSQG